MHKYEEAEGAKLPQNEITYSNNLSSEFIKLSECIPIEPELFLFIDCFDVFGDSCPICGRQSNEF